MFCFRLAPQGGVGAILLAAGIAATFQSAAVIAAPPPDAESSSPTLRWLAARERLLQAHPALTVFQQQRAVLASQRELAAQRPVTSLGLDIENVAGSGAARGIDAAESTLSLGRRWEWGGQAAARVAVVDIESSAVSLQQQQVALDLLAGLARHYLAVARNQAELQLHQQRIELAESAVQLLQRRVRAGRSPGAELRRAEAALAEARIQRAALQQRASAARSALAAMWGGETAEFSTVALDLSLLPPRLDEEALLAAIETHPKLLALATEARLREARQRLAASRGRGYLDWQLGLRHLAEIDDAALVAGISLPLFSARREQPAVEAARAATLQPAAEQQARRRELRGMVHGTLGQYGAARLQQQRIAAEVVAPLQQALTETRDGWERGAYSYLDFLAARRELLAAKQAVLDAAHTARLAHIELEWITGMALQQADPLSANPADNPGAMQ